MGSCWNGVCRTSSTRSWTRWHSHYEYVKIAQNQTWSRVENEKLDGTWWNLCGTSDAFHWQKNKDLCKSRLEPTWGEEFARQGSTDWRPNHGWVGKWSCDWGLSHPSSESFQDSILEPTSIILNLHVARSRYFGQASHHLRPNWHAKTLQVKQRAKD